MKQYKQVPEDAEYREYYDSYRLTVDNLNDTDYLYKTSLSNGQVFFEFDEVFGYVNNQAAVRNRNLTITSDYIDNFVIRDFRVFSRALNDIIYLDINCNLKDYRDGKPHYLYIVLSHRGKYEVYDDMFQSDETKLLFARFIIDTQGNSIQFYMMLPFAGSADYIKGNQFYQVTDGLRVKVVNNNTKQLTLSNAKIRFSGINFDDVSSPDCLVVDFEGSAVPIRYVKWDSSDGLPRVDWISDTVDKLNLTKIMNYSTGALSNVANGKYSIQKLYYDVYEKCIVAMYGNAIYNSREEAIYAIDSVMSYPLPDGIEYLIPIAVIVAENTSSAISNDNFRIVNLDYNEQEVLDSDTFTRQQAAEAIQKSNQAIQISNNISDVLDEHVGDRTNPHQVKLNQLYNSSGQLITLADDYANYSVSSILSAAQQQAANNFYAKTGGPISGDVSISRTLTVTGRTTLDDLLTANGGMSLGGSISLKSNNSYDIGTSSIRLKKIYTNSIDATGNSSITGELTSCNIIPSVSVSYNLGSLDKRYNTVYTNSVNASGVISGSSASISGTLSAGNTTINGNLSMGSSKKITVDKGYLIIGDIALGLGSTFTPPAGINEAYAIY